MGQAQLISRTLKKINHLYTKILVKELVPYQMDHHFEALHILGNQEAPITQNKLAELMQTDKSRIAIIVFDLEKRGLVDIKINPGDRRQHHIHLSSLATTAFPNLEKTVEKINLLTEAGIPQDKLQVFFEVSEMMRQNLLNSVY